MESRAPALGTLETWVSSSPRSLVANSGRPLTFTPARPISYPGVIVAEGLAHNVDAFVQIVKSWQWKALQVRCEIDGEKVDPPADVSVRDAPLWTVRTRSHLGRVLDADGTTKVGAREVEGLNELGELYVLQRSSSFLGSKRLTRESRAQHAICWVRGCFSDCNEATKVTLRPVPPERERI